MSERRLSRGIPASRFPISNFADLRDAIAADGSLGVRQKEARRSACAKFCDWLHRSSQDVAVDLRTVMLEFKRLDPALCGVSTGRFNNVKSLISRSLVAYRTDIVDTRQTPLAPSWRALFDAIKDPAVERGCGRFARWATVSGLHPCDINQAVADRYASELETRMLASAPRQAQTGMIRTWNAAAADYPTVWPQVRLDAGDRRRIYVLPSEKIDPRFKADLESMLTQFGSPLALVEGFRAPLAKRTIDELKRVLRRLYTIAVRHHRPTPVVASLGDLVRIDVVESILGYYLERFGADNTKSAAKYAHVLYVIAKYWVKVPEDQLAVLSRHRSVLKPQSRGMTEKNRALLRRFADETLVERLLWQGHAAVAAFLRLKRPRRPDALALQMALAVELLIAAPVRSQNLVSISVSRHLCWGRHGKRDTLHLIFPAREVKNDVDLEFRLPARVIDILKVYITKARPLLAVGGSDHLFPGRGVRHKAPDVLSEQIARTMSTVVGVRMTAHQFRHLVGYLYLQAHPAGHEVVRRFLGHKRIVTTIAFYAGMEVDAAIKLYDQHIEALRLRLVRQRSAPARGRSTQSASLREKMPANPMKPSKKEPSK